MGIPDLEWCRPELVPGLLVRTRARPENRLALVGVPRHSPLQKSVASGEVEQPLVDTALNDRRWSGEGIVRPRKESRRAPEVREDDEQSGDAAGNERRRVGAANLWSRRRALLQPLHDEHDERAQSCGYGYDERQ